MLQCYLQKRLQVRNAQEVWNHCISLMPQLRAKIYHAVWHAIVNQLDCQSPTRLGRRMQSVGVAVGLYAVQMCLEALGLNGTSQDPDLYISRVSSSYSCVRHLTGAAKRE